MKGIFCAFNLRKFNKLVFYILTPLIVGSIAASVIGDAAGFYDTLAKPAVSPPVWLFVPCWTVMFVLMGTAAFLAGDSYADQATKRRGRTLYYAQLAANFMWPIIFFRARNFGFAFAWVVLLLVLVVAVTVTFYDMRRRAGWLMVPYLAWAAYAGYLNYIIWMLS